MISINESGKTISDSAKNMKKMYKESLIKIKQSIKNNDKDTIIKECDKAINIIKEYKNQIKSDKSKTSEIIIRQLLSLAPTFLFGLTDFDIDIDNEGNINSIRFGAGKDKNHIKKGIRSTAIAAGLKLAYNAGRTAIKKDVDMNEFLDKAKITALSQCDKAIEKLESIKKKYS